MRKVTKSIKSTIGHKVDNNITKADLAQHIYTLFQKKNYVKILEFGCDEVTHDTGNYAIYDQFPNDQELFNKILEVIFPRIAHGKDPKYQIQIGSCLYHAEIKVETDDLYWHRTLPSIRSEYYDLKIDLQVEYIDNITLYSKDEIEFVFKNKKFEVKMEAI